MQLRPYAKRAGLVGHSIGDVMQVIVVGSDSEGLGHSYTQ
jgi:hypothetical protein